MQTMRSSKKGHYMKRTGIFLLVVALIVGMAGCSSPASYDLTVSGTTGGSVTTPGEGTFTYDEGTVVNLVAETEEGYLFVNWTGDVDTIANVNAASTGITINGNYSITANFEYEGVYFADPNLRAAIREAIGIPEDPICASDLAGLTSLSASEKNIADLTGLEHCTSLTYLYLSDNRISDISPLANLTSLISLSLSRNRISDISPLANLTSLTYLSLSTNQISDISPLVHNEGLSEGDKAYLSGNPLSSDSINIYIPQLEARGVTVEY